MLVTSLTLIQNDTVHRKLLLIPKYLQNEINNYFYYISNYGEFPLVNLSTSMLNDQFKHKKNSRA